MAICSGSNIWDNRMSFLFGSFLESTVIKFWCQHGNWSFSRKSKFKLEECLLLQDEHIVVFLCFYFSCWPMKCILSCVEMKKYLRLGEDEQLGSFKINTTTWVSHSQCKNACVLSHIDHDMFCFLMARMTGAG